MKVIDQFPSKYLKASHLEDREVRGMMSHVEMGKLGDGKEKPVLYFKKFDRDMPADSMVLNVTNTKVISAAFGDDSDNWDGKVIVLYPAMVQFKDEMVEAIRVKIPKPTAPAKPKAHEPPPAEFDQADDDAPIPF